MTWVRLVVCLSRVTKNKPEVNTRFFSVMLYLNLSEYFTLRTFEMPIGLTFSQILFIYLVLVIFTQARIKVILNVYKFQINVNKILYNKISYNLTKYIIGFMQLTSVRCSYGTTKSNLAK